jgi:hypothetical protein
MSVRKIVASMAVLHESPDLAGNSIAGFSFTPVPTMRFEVSYMASSFLREKYMVYYA